MGTSIKAIIGSSSALVSIFVPNSKMTRGNGLGFWTREGGGGYQYNMHEVPWPCSAKGKFGVIRSTCFNMACNSKRLITEENNDSNLGRGHL